MSVITKTFTATGQFSDPLQVNKGDRFSYRAGVGGGAINLQIQFSENGQTFDFLPLTYDSLHQDINGDFSKRLFTAERTGHYRMFGVEQAAGSFIAQLQDEPRVLEGPIQNSAGQIVWQVTEAGVEGLESGTILGPGAAVAVPVRSYGLDIDEGLGDLVIEETITLPTDNTTIDITDLIPTGVLIFSIAARMTEAAADGGTRTKIVVGISGGDLDKYIVMDPELGETGEALYPNGSTVLGGTEQLAISGTTTADPGLEGDTNWTDGQVRIHVVYRQLRALSEAIIVFP